MKIADFKPKQDREVFHVRLPRGFYITYDNDYSGKGWGWTDEIQAAACFDKETAAKVSKLAADEYSVRIDFPVTTVVVDIKGNYVPTTDEELAQDKKPKADFGW